MLCPQCSRQNPSGARFCNGCGTELPEPHASVSRDAASRFTVSPDFVGRQHEIGELVSALDEVIAGRGRLVMLAGEPGIGKTRTAQELAAIAEERGARVLWGYCLEQQGTPPYWPWVQAIRSYVRECEAEQLRSEMGPGAADIAEIVSDVRERLPDLGPPPTLESPEQARFRLFDSITTFLKTACRSQPLLLILDNLHWADKPSLLLLEFLIQELATSHLLVVGTYRDVELSRQHPLSEVLGDLTRERLFQRVPLRGLSEAEVGRFMHIATGTERPQDLVEAVHSHTEGNPLFLAEVVRMLEQEGEPTPARLGPGDTRNFRIPEGVREAIGRRLNRLSEACNRMLTIASVIGPVFYFNHLIPLIEELSEDRLLEALDEALEARVVEELPEDVARYQFTHALIQRTLRDELSAARRVRLHARIATALEEQYGAEAHAHSSELAHHFAEAEPVLGNEKLVHYSRLAGEQALARYAWEDAAGHFQRALEAKEGESSASGPAKDADTAALLLGFGRALSFTDRWEEAVKGMARALDYFEEVGDVASAVAAADCSFAPAGWQSHFPIVARVIQMVPPESHDAGRILSRYGLLAAHVEFDYQEAQDAFSRAVAIARRERDASLEMWTLQKASFAYLLALNWDKSLATAIEAIQMAPEADNPMAETIAHHSAATALLHMGYLGRAKVHAANSLQPAERSRHIFRMSWALEINEQVASAAGEWDAARGFSDRHLALDSPVMEEQLASRALLEYQTGDLTQCERYIERLDESRNRRAPPRVTDRVDRLWLVDLARISGVTGRLHVVKAAAEAILSSPRVSPIFARAASVALALTAIHEGDDALCAELYPTLEPFRSTLDTDGLISLDRLLGLLAHTMGKLDDAASHFEDSVAFCRKAGYLPELAWTCHDYAALRLAQDREKTVDLLDEALLLAEELGMRPLVEQVVALREKAESVPAKPYVYPDRLTEREVEVLRLIAAGKTDREIAEELFISIRTVGNHVHNILNKTTTTNRAEAAAYATRHDLA